MSRKKLFRILRARSSSSRKNRCSKKLWKLLMQWPIISTARVRNSNANVKRTRQHHKLSFQEDWQIARAYWQLASERDTYCCYACKSLEPDLIRDSCPA